MVSDVFTFSDDIYYCKYLKILEKLPVLIKNTVEYCLINHIFTSHGNVAAVYR